VTKTITTDWKGGSRRIKLRDPGEMKRMHHLATAPTPMKLSPAALAWINTTIKLGSELEIDTIEEMFFVDGINLLSEVLNYWQTLQDGSLTDDTDKVGKGEQPEFEGIELNEEGAVDLEEMQ